MKFDQMFLLLQEVEEASKIFLRLMMKLLFEQLLLVQSLLSLLLDMKRILRWLILLPIEGPPRHLRRRSLLCLT